MDHDDLHDHDRGLSHDLPALLSRRLLLAALGGVGGLVALAGCDPGTSTASGAASAAAGGQIPEETAGPYPGDGSNGVNVLTQSGIVRSDITPQLRLGIGRRPRDTAHHQAHRRCRRPTPPGW